MAHISDYEFESFERILRSSEKPNEWTAFLTSPQTKRLFMQTMAEIFHSLNLNDAVKDLQTANIEKFDNFDDRLTGNEIEFIKFISERNKLNLIYTFKLMNEMISKTPFKSWAQFFNSVNHDSISNYVLKQSLDHKLNYLRGLVFFTTKLKSKFLQVPDADKLLTDVLESYQLHINLFENLIDTENYPQALSEDTVDLVIMNILKQKELILRILHNLFVLVDIGNNRRFFAKIFFLYFKGTDLTSEIFKIFNYYAVDNSFVNHKYKQIIKRISISIRFIFIAIFSTPFKSGLSKENKQKEANVNYEALTKISDNMSQLDKSNEENVIILELYRLFVIGTGAIIDDFHNKEELKNLIAKLEIFEDIECPEKNLLVVIDSLKNCFNEDSNLHFRWSLKTMMNCICIISYQDSWEEKRYFQNQDFFISLFIKGLKEILKSRQILAEFWYDLKNNDYMALIVNDIFSSYPYCSNDFVKLATAMLGVNDMESVINLKRILENLKFITLELNEGILKYLELQIEDEQEGEIPLKANQTESEKDQDLSQTGNKKPLINYKKKPVQENCSKFKNQPNSPKVYSILEDLHLDRFFILKKGTPGHVVDKNDKIIRFQYNFDFIDYVYLEMFELAFTQTNLISDEKSDILIFFCKLIVASPNLIFEFHEKNINKKWLMGKENAIRSKELQKNENPNANPETEKPDEANNKQPEVTFPVTIVAVLIELARKLIVKEDSLNIHVWIYKAISSLLRSSAYETTAFLLKMNRIILDQYSSIEQSFSVFYECAMTQLMITDNIKTKVLFYDGVKAILSIFASLLSHEKSIIEYSLLYNKSGLEADCIEQFKQIRGDASFITRVVKPDELETFETELCAFYNKMMFEPTLIFPFDLDQFFDNILLKIFVMFINSNLHLIDGEIKAKYELFTEFYGVMSALIIKAGLGSSQTAVEMAKKNVHEITLTQKLNELLNLIPVKELFEKSFLSIENVNYTYVVNMKYWKPTNQTEDPLSDQQSFLGQIIQSQRIPEYSFGEIQIPPTHEQITKHRNDFSIINLHVSNAERSYALIDPVHSFLIASANFFTDLFQMVTELLKNEEEERYPNFIVNLMNNFFSFDSYLKSNIKMKGGLFLVNFVSNILNVCCNQIDDVSLLKLQSFMNKTAYQFELFEVQTIEDFESKYDDTVSLLYRQSQLQTLGLCKTRSLYKDLTISSSCFRLLTSLLVFWREMSESRHPHFSEFLSLLNFEVTNSLLFISIFVLEIHRGLKDLSLPVFDFLIECNKSQPDFIVEILQNSYDLEIKANTLFRLLTAIIGDLNKKVTTKEESNNLKTPFISITILKTAQLVCGLLQNKRIKKEDINVIWNTLFSNICHLVFNGFEESNELLNNMLHYNDKFMSDNDILIAVNMSSRAAFFLKLDAQIETLKTFDSTFLMIMQVITDSFFNVTGGELDRFIKIFSKDLLIRLFNGFVPISSQFISTSIIDLYEQFQVLGEHFSDFIVAINETNNNCLWDQDTNKIISAALPIRFLNVRSTLEHLEADEENKRWKRIRKLRDEFSKNDAKLQGKLKEEATKAINEQKLKQKSNETKNFTETKDQNKTRQFMEQQMQPPEENDFVRSSLTLDKLNNLRMTKQIYVFPRNNRYGNFLINKKELQLFSPFQIYHNLIFGKISESNSMLAADYGNLLNRTQEVLLSKERLQRGFADFVSIIFSVGIDGYCFGTRYTPTSNTYGINHMLDKFNKEMANAPNQALHVKHPSFISKFYSSFAKQEIPTDENTKSYQNSDLENSLLNPFHETQHRFGYNLWCLFLINNQRANPGSSLSSSSVTAQSRLREFSVLIEYIVKNQSSIRHIKPPKVNPEGGPISKGNQIHSRNSENKARHEFPIINEPKHKNDSFTNQFLFGIPSVSHSSMNLLIRLSIEHLVAINHMITADETKNESTDKQLKGNVSKIYSLVHFLFMALKQKSEFTKPVQIVNLIEELIFHFFYYCRAIGFKENLRDLDQIWKHFISKPISELTKFLPIISCLSIIRPEFIQEKDINALCKILKAKESSADDLILVLGIFYQNYFERKKDFDLFLDSDLLGSFLDMPFFEHGVGAKYDEVYDYDRTSASHNVFCYMISLLTNMSCANEKNVILNRRLMNIYTRFSYKMESIINLRGLKTEDNQVVYNSMLDLQKLNAYVISNSSLNYSKMDSKSKSDSLQSLKNNSSKPKPQGTFWKVGQKVNASQSNSDASQLNSNNPREIDFTYSEPIKIGTCAYTLGFLEELKVVLSFLKTVVINPINWNSQFENTLATIFRTISEKIIPFFFANVKTEHSRIQKEQLQKPEDAFVPYSLLEINLHNIVMKYCQKNESRKSSESISDSNLAESKLIDLSERQNYDLHSFLTEIKILEVLFLSVDLFQNLGLHFTESLHSNTFKNLNINFYLLLSSNFLRVQNYLKDYFIRLGDTDFFQEANLHVSVMKTSEFSFRETAGLFQLDPIYSYQEIKNFTRRAFELSVFCQRICFNLFENSWVRPTNEDLKVLKKHQEESISIINAFSNLQIGIDGRTLNHQIRSERLKKELSKSADPRQMNFTKNLSLDLNSEILENAMEEADIKYSELHASTIESLRITHQWKS